MRCRKEGVICKQFPGLRSPIALSQWRDWAIQFRVLSPSKGSRGTWLRSGIYGDSIVKLLDSTGENWRSFRRAQHNRNPDYTLRMEKPRLSPGQIWNMNFGFL